MPEHDSLVTVRRSNEFLLHQSGRPLNYQWGHWHDYSQDLETLYVVTGALFIARKVDILKWYYLIGVKPVLFETTKVEAMDVDDEEDLEIAGQYLSYLRGKAVQTCSKRSGSATEELR